VEEGDSLGVVDTKVQIRVRRVKFTTFIMNYFLKRKWIYVDTYSNVCFLSFCG